MRADAPDPADSPALADTNLLVYLFDLDEPAKRGRAREILRAGAVSGNLVLPQQALVEFVSVTTRPRGGRPPLLAFPDACRAVDGFIAEFDVLWPTAAVLRTALSGMALHGLSWYDSHLWAFAEVSGIPVLLSEDFQDGRACGRVRVVNPFRDL